MARVNPVKWEGDSFTVGTTTYERWKTVTTAQGTVIEEINLEALAKATELGGLKSDYVSDGIAGLCIRALTGRGDAVKTNTIFRNSPMGAENVPFTLSNMLHLSGSVAGSIGTSIEAPLKDKDDDQPRQLEALRRTREEMKDLTIRVEGIPFGHFDTTQPELEFCAIYDESTQQYMTMAPVNPLTKVMRQEVKEVKVTRSNYSGEEYNVLECEAVLLAMNADTTRLHGDRIQSVYKTREIVIEKSVMQALYDDIKIFIDKLAAAKYHYHYQRNKKYEKIMGLKGALGGMRGFFRVVRKKGKSVRTTMKGTVSKNVNSGKSFNCSDSSGFISRFRGGQSGNNPRSQATSIARGAKNALGIKDKTLKKKDITQLGRRIRRMARGSDSKQRMCSNEIANLLHKEAVNEDETNIKQIGSLIRGIGGLVSDMSTAQNYNLSVSAAQSWICTSIPGYHQICQGGLLQKLEGLTREILTYYNTHNCQDTVRYCTSWELAIQLARDFTGERGVPAVMSLMLGVELTTHGLMTQLNSSWNKQFCTQQFPVDTVVGTVAPINEPIFPIKACAIKGNTSNPNAKAPLNQLGSSAFGISGVSVNPAAIFNRQNTERGILSCLKHLNSQNWIAHASRWITITDAGDIVHLGELDLPREMQDQVGGLAKVNTQIDVNGNITHEGTTVNFITFFKEMTRIQNGAKPPSPFYEKLTKDLDMNNPQDRAMLTPSGSTRDYRVLKKITDWMGYTRPFEMTANKKEAYTKLVANDVDMQRGMEAALNWFESNPEIFRVAGESI